MWGVLHDKTIDDSTFITTNTESWTTVVATTLNLIENTIKLKSLDSRISPLGILLDAAGKVIVVPGGNTFL